MQAKRENPADRDNVEAFHALKSPSPFPLPHWGRGWRSRVRGLRGHDDIIAFAFAQQQVFAEQEVVPSHGPLRTSFADVVDVNPPPLDVLSGLAFRRAKSRMDQQL